VHPKPALSPETGVFDPEQAGEFEEVHELHDVHE